MFSRGIADNQNDLKVLDLIRNTLGISVDEDEYSHDFRIYAGIYRYTRQLQAVEELFLTLMRAIDRHVPSKNLLKLGEVDGSSLIKQTHRAVQDNALPGSGSLHGYQGENRDIIFRLAGEWGREGLLILLCGSSAETRKARAGTLATAHLETAAAAALESVKNRLLRRKKQEVQQRLQELSGQVRGVDERDGDTRFRRLRIKLWKLDLMGMNSSELDLELSEMVSQYDREEAELFAEGDEGQLQMLRTQIAFLKDLKARGGVTGLRRQLLEPAHDTADSGTAFPLYDWGDHNFCAPWTEEIDTGAPWYAGLDFGGAAAPV